MVVVSVPNVPYGTSHPEPPPPHSHKYLDLAHLTIEVARETVAYWVTIMVGGHLTVEVAA